METWIFPITMLPGVGLLILSTSTFVTSLSEEIDHLSHHDENLQELIKLKIHQLGLINKALVGLYLCAGFFSLAGLFMGITEFIDTNRQFHIIILGLGVLFLILSLVILVIFSSRSVKIRKRQFNESIKSQSIV